jgi:hypothetical protein
MGVGGISTGVFRQRNPTGFAARQGAARARGLRLASAARRVLSPGLDSGQNQVLSNLGNIAGMRGLFGGALQGPEEAARTQFLAGNRLSGLDALVDDFFNFKPRGVSRADQARGPDAPALLAEIQGLRNQFFFGGQAGQQNVANIDPGLIGSQLGRERGTDSGRPTPFQAFDRETGARIVSDQLGAPAPQAPQRDFGFASSLLPSGLEGLSQSLLGPFNITGGGTQASLLGKGDQSFGMAQQLFSPLLFRG